MHAPQGIIACFRILSWLDASPGGCVCDGACGFILVVCCWYAAVVQDLEANADLVIIEYSANGYGGQCQCFTALQNAGFETLMRKVGAPQPPADWIGNTSRATLWF